MSRAESPLRDRMIFNCGARRSGTLWLQRIITAHPGISAIPSESSVFSHGIAPLFERFHYGGRSSPQLAGLYVEQEAVLDATRDLCDVVFSSHLEPHSRYLAERTAVHVLHMELMNDIYPDARFIHIIRDGRDVVRSIAAQPWGETVAEAAAEWRSSVEAGRTAGIPTERYREVRYETLLEDPEPTIAALFEWLDLPVTDGVLEQALIEAGRRKNVDKHGQPGVASGKWRHTLTHDDLNAIQWVAGDLLAELGYTAEEVGLSRDGHPKPRPATPWWGRRAMRTVLRKLPPAVGAWPDFHRRLNLADRALAELMQGRLGELTAITAPDALVKVVSNEGIEARRGASGHELLHETVAASESLAGRQVLGDTFPGIPTIGYVLRLERDGGEAADRAIFITIAGGVVTELTIYLLPLSGG
jgi:Sulfotransferase family